MGKKRVALLLMTMLLFTSLCQPIWSAQDAVQDYEPYRKDEFPIWSGKIRRAEILFFGSLAITLPVTMLGFNVAQSQFGYIPQGTDTQKMLRQAGIAAGISLGIVLADFIIGEMQK